MVGKGTSGGECYGEYNSTTGTGSGAGYVNSCIHSDSNDYTSGNTVWYNYVLASAGTIKNTSSTDTAGNMNIATESICPKNWSLPTVTQTRSIAPDAGSATYIDSFSPTLGGRYSGGSLKNESTRGFWWGNVAGSSALRYSLYYDGSIIYTGAYNRRDGLYIRCVSEEKDVSD